VLAHVREEEEEESSPSSSQTPAPRHHVLFADPPPAVPQLATLPPSTPRRHVITNPAQLTPRRSPARRTPRGRSSRVQRQAGSGREGAKDVWEFFKLSRDEDLCLLPVCSLFEASNV
jgi:hypothetical protein